ncbi:MAG: UvrD-helicase domain-containing protein, partial [bacterium]|nr:UvrD-helicase domain-containing protein [bacterium]
MLKSSGNFDQELIIRKELLTDESNIFVKAGAGAGKSTSLVARIIGFLATKDSPKDFVAITFTNKAAEELRQKIINTLNKRIKKETNQEAKEKLIKALNEIDLMHISTIHKFCGDILRENSIYANLSPDFKILEDSDDKARQVDFLNLKLRGLRRTDFNRLNILYETKNDIKKKIESAFFKLLSFVDVINLEDIYNISMKDSTIDFDSIKEVFREYCDYVKELCDNYNVGSMFNKLYKFLDAYDGDISIYKDAEIKKKFKDIYGLLGKEDDKLFPLNKPAFKKLPLVKAGVPEDIINDTIEEISEILSKYKEKNDAIVMKQTALIYEKAHEFYTEYLDYISKDKENISNNQSIYLTKKLLEDNQTIREKMKKQYKHIYIDEYQDTDHTQRDIAYMLTRNSDGSFIDNALYVVGDPKQSIYRFRGAEPEVYTSTEKDYVDADNNIYDLNINFRSNSVMLDYINNTFSGVDLLGDGSTYKPMLCAKKNVIEDSALQNDENLLGAYKFEGVEPYQIAELIKKIKKDYKIRNLYENDDTKEIEVKYEDIKYKDFMILMQNHKDMGRYVSEFTRRNIPSKVSGESNFRIVEELRAFVNLFESITTRNEKNFEMASSVIRTVFPSKFVDLKYDEEKDVINELWNELKDKTKNMSAYGKAMYLANHLEWIVEDNSENKGFIMNSVSSKINQMIEEIFANGYANGNDIAKKFRDYLDAVIEYESLNDDEADCVHIINTHKAKGLEAKIVIWVAIDTTFDFSTTFMDGKLYVRDSSMNLVDDTCEQKLINADRNEKIRLEYVAATRGGEAFILTHKEEASGLFYRKDGLSYIDKIDKEIKLELLEEQVSNEEGASNNSSNATPYSSVDKIYNNTPSLSITSPSGTEKASPTRTREANNKIPKTNDDRPSNNVIGTIMHKAFELLVKDDKHDVDRQVNKAITSNKDFVSDVDKLKDF